MKIKIIVHLDTGDEEYTFDDEKEAQWFCADVLSKCGQITFTRREIYD